MRGSGIIILLFILVIFSRTHGQYDPITDFAVPYSMSEQIHAGLCFVEQNLKKTASVDCDVMLQVNDQLTKLNQLSQNISDSNNFHGIYRDERATLQAMIDRIDALLEALAVDDADDQSSVDRQQVVQDNRNLLHGVRDIILV